MKILVSLDPQLVRRLDEEATARHTSRSALISELADRGLSGSRGPGASPEVRQAIEDTRSLVREAWVADPWMTADSAKAVREMRDSAR